MEELSVEAMQRCRLPGHFVDALSILEANFELDDEGTLPYEVFDCLRTWHRLDLTGFTTSMTQRGNLYRNYVLMKGG